MSQSGNGVAPVTNGSNNRASAMAGPDDDDDEYDRGHWGSKAEFILSCVGFSVSGFLVT